MSASPEISIWLPTESPAFSVDAVTAVPSSVWAALQLSVAVPLRLLSPRGEIVADINEYVPVLVVRELVFHNPDMLTGTHLGRNAILQPCSVIADLATS